jgi:hypothetical protein
MWTLRVVTLISVFFISFTLTGCLEEAITGSESGSTMVGAINPDPSFSPSRNVCDPFKTNSQQARDRGLVGSLVYLTEDQPRYDNVQDYLDHAVLAPVTIYLDRLYTPPRPFDLGFKTQSGEEVKTVNGDTLYKYFGIQVKSQLRLADVEAPGYYQLALHASEGARLKLTDENGVEQEIVNTSVAKASKFACSTVPVYLDHDSKIPLTLEYYQADGKHLSLMAVWRPWPGPDAKNSDDICQSDSHSLFEYSDIAPAVAKTKFYEKLAAGWKVLENENFVFPEQEENPCVPTEAPLAITNFRILSLSRNSAVLEWNTNIPATSQVKYEVAGSGVQQVSAASQALVLYHQVTLSGLSANTLYNFQGISTTPSGQSSISDVRSIRTPR